MKNPLNKPPYEGLLLINKPKGRTSFSLVTALRKRTGVQKIGHAGTLDPFATGVMILLVGQNYTRQSDRFLHLDKEYLANLKLGITTDTFDCDGNVQSTSDIMPSLATIDFGLAQFQGKVMQIPPMFSAKKVGGKKLYELARKGIEIERNAVEVTLTTTLLTYEYPYLSLKIACSKGTYIRSLAHDLGTLLGCGAHLADLTRLRTGPYHLLDCVDGSKLDDPLFDVKPLFRRQ